MEVLAVMKKFGGARKLARRLQMPPSTVQSWVDVGLIPSKHITRILEAGKDLDPPLVIEDLFPPRKRGRAA